MMLVANARTLQTHECSKNKKNGPNTSCHHCVSDIQIGV